MTASGCPSKSDSYRFINRGHDGTVLASWYRSMAPIITGSKIVVLVVLCLFSSMMPLAD